MTDEPRGDERVEETQAADASAPPPKQNGNGETISEQVQSSRDMIPVGDRGVNPATYAQWIDIAKDICRAKLMLPEHLHGNAPVMAGLLEIAARFQLSAYMLASKTYVQNNRLCFEAQAFGAIMYGSGLLRGRLRFRFNGEGEERTCTVSGVFKDDPQTICEATTPPLKDIHPGRTQKEGKTYVKGSPLWDKDPEQQLCYFGERRWIRRFAPDACMGMYTREEIAEIDEYRADTQGAIPLTADRLGQTESGEGWQQGAHVDLDLASIAPEQPEGFEQAGPVYTEEEIAEETARATAPRPPRTAQRRPAQKAKPPARAAKPQAKKKPLVRPARPRPGRIPPKVVVQAAVKRAEAGPRKVVTAKPPAWLDYVQRTEAWVKAVADLEQGEKADLRWESERDDRDRLQVPMGERSRLRAQLDRQLARFRPRPKQEDDE